MEHDLEVWICLVILSVGFCDVDDLIAFLVVDFLEYVCPDLNSAFGIVSESGDGDVEVVVELRLVEDVAWEWV